MRWGEQGGQAILSFRALVQSNRFERAWTLLAHTYKAEVTWTLDNVDSVTADTQLAMIGVSMRVTPLRIKVINNSRSVRRDHSSMPEKTLETERT